MATDDHHQPASPPPVRAEAHEGHDHGTGNCDEALAELYTFIDGELTVERRTLIAGHLDDCNPCFEAFDFEAELRIVIAHHCRDSVPEDLRQRIAAQLESIEDLACPPPPSGPTGDG
jgi:mycothiol system anti-sigma-R factor